MVGETAKARIESDFMYEGQRCVVIAQPSGVRYGYVGVPKDHPFFGKLSDDKDIESLQVHGGVGYAGNAYLEGLNGGLWWISFHCGHDFGGVDPSILNDKYKEFISFWDGPEFRTREYVEEECRSLAKQLSKV
jgi:hypothetical protein